MNDVVQLTTLTYARAASKLEVGFDVVFCVEHVQSLLGVGGGRVPGSIIRVPLSWYVVQLTILTYARAASKLEVGRFDFLGARLNQLFCVCGAP